VKSGRNSEANEAVWQNHFLFELLTKCKVSERSREGNGMVERATKFKVGEGLGERSEGPVAVPIELQVCK
jgi:hypothetical protein